MSLSLVTGPANAAKAGWVLDRLRALAPRSPLLVVPTAGDVAHYRHELAAGHTVIGVQVLTFDGLAREMAVAAGLDARALGPVARTRTLRAAIGEVRLPTLGRSASMVGFADAVGSFVAELQRSLVRPAALRAGVERWRAAGGDLAPAPPRHIDELLLLLDAHAARTASRPDREGLAWRALDALRSDPGRWGTRPVLLYGFDDLTAAQRDAVEVLGRLAGADVTVALPYEPGREAFASSAGAVEALVPLVDGEHEELGPRPDHYAAAGRDALHHLERHLFEPDPPRASPGDAVRLLEAGGERAEAELVAAELLGLLGQGVAAHEIAVVTRAPQHAVGVLEAVFDAYGIPLAHEVARPLARTRLGAGLLAAGTLARGRGTVRDVLVWLRTPGRGVALDVLDELEVRARRLRVTSADGILAIAADLPELTGPLAELRALRVAGEADVEAFLVALAAELEALWVGPVRRRGAKLSPHVRGDADVAAAVGRALDELRGLAARDPALVPDADAVLEALGDLEADDRPPVPGGVVLSDPLAIRARRFRAVAVMGLQEGLFPARPAGEPFLSDDERRALAEAGGPRLPAHEGELARERHLFYACVSRPERTLLLSWRSSDEEGNPLEVSSFVDDVRAVFDETLWDGRRRRTLADVTWSVEGAPTEPERRRAQAATRRELPKSPGAPREEAVLALLAAREQESAGKLEAFAACGVRWLVERMLAPAPIEADADALRRGSLAHAILESTYNGLRARTGHASVTPGRLPAARAALHDAVAEHTPADADIGMRATLRSIEVDAGRLLAFEADQGTGLDAHLIEWGFGGPGDEHPALELEPGGMRVNGRVDRIDLDADGRAVVVDLKTGKVVAGARWEEDGRLQVALYALAARDMLGLDPVAAVFQPLRGADLAPRGIVRTVDDEERDPAVPARGWKAKDLRNRDRFEEALQGARLRALQAAADMRAGRITACPGTCTPKGCAYPTICRAGGDA